MFPLTYHDYIEEKRKEIRERARKEADASNKWLKDKVGQVGEYISSGWRSLRDRVQDEINAEMEWNSGNYTQRAKDYGRRTEALADWLSRVEVMPNIRDIRRDMDIPYWEWDTDTERRDINEWRRQARERMNFRRWATQKWSRDFYGPSYRRYERKPYKRYEKRPLARRTIIYRPRFYFKRRYKKRNRYRRYRRFNKY